MRLNFYASRIAIFVFFLALLNPARAQVNQTSLKEIQLLLQEKASRTPAQQKIDSKLLQFVREKRGQKMVEGVNLEPVKLKETSGGRVAVDIDGDITDNLITRIESSGARIIFASIKFKKITAEVSPSMIEAIAGFPEIKFIGPKAEPELVRNDLNKNEKNADTKKAGQATTFKPGFEERAKRVSDYIKKYMNKHAAGAAFFAGPVTSEGDRAHRADDARNTYGYQGQGIKIGVISDSYDAKGVASVDVANGELPGTGNPIGNTTPVTVLQDVAGQSDEGRAMLQIVHDLAPKAQLFFATAFVSEAGFAANIEALRAAPYNCDIIIDDVSYSDEPAFYDGIVAQAVNNVTAAGALYFSSAGNSGSLGKNTAGVYEGDFNDVGSLAFTSGSKVGTIHNFGTVGSPVNGDIITVLSGRCGLFWADVPGASTNDYDLFLLSSAGTVKASSTNVQTGSQNPFEEIAPTSIAAGDRLVIFKKAGAANLAFHLNTGRGKLTVATNGQTHGHASAANAYCVAATPAIAPGPYPGVFNTANQVETFSSDGPRRIFFNSNGTAITPGNFLFATNGGTVRSKPDITAADGVSTTLAPSSGLNPFYGTSAAAPHAGAIAALLKSANPSLTATQIRTLLTTTVTDIETAGNDVLSGAGIVNAFQAMQALNPSGVASLKLGTINISEGSFSNANGVIDPQEVGNISLQLQNLSPATASNITATITTTTPGVTITDGTKSYSTINSGNSATNSTPFVFGVSSSVTCGTIINFAVTITLNGGLSPQGYAFSTVVGVQPYINGINATLGSTPPTGSGYTATSGQQTGRLARSGTASTCSVPGTGGLTTTLGSRQFDAYTFTNSGSTSQCVTATMTASNGINLFVAAYNSAGFVPSNPALNYLAASGSSTPTQSFSFNVAAGQNFTVVVHDINVTPASNSPYKLVLSLANCSSSGGTCVPMNISTTTIASGATGSGYNQAFSASGGSGTYLFSESGDLPAGLSFSGNTLSGTPTQAGSFPITISAADVTGCASTVTANFTLQVGGTLPFAVTATAGTPQSSGTEAVFSTALQAKVTDAGNNPLSGVNVSFKAPAFGASGTFAGGVLNASVVTNASGIAVAPTFTANTTLGAYTVTATVVNLPAVNFSLQNICIPSTTNDTLDFEGTFPPSGLTIVNPDNSTTWTKASGIIGPAGTATSAAFLDFYHYSTVAQTDDMVTKPYSVFSSSAVQFDLAYARYDAANFDRLLVLVSKDCGVTFTDTIYDKKSTVLATTSDNVNPFAPSSASQWRREVLSLSAYAGQLVKLKFRAINGFGNNIYVDNIAIVAQSAITDYFRTKASGNWNSTATWESSADNINWHAATLTPDFNANIITIKNGHDVIVTSNVTTDQTIVQPLGSVAVSTGITLTVNSTGLTLQSDATGTARIANSAGGAIAGNVTVERFIPQGKRAYRQLASGVNSTSNILSNWQNNGANTTGRGIHITGSTTGANGFDQTQTGSASMLTYTPGAAGFTAIPGTNGTNKLNALQGYRVFVIGDRNANLTIANNTGTGTSNIALNNSTTLSASGTLLMGTVTYNNLGATANGSTDNSIKLGALPAQFALIANPYWSPVNFDLVTKADIFPTYWIWDQSIGFRGAYVSYSSSTGISSGGFITKDIQPGQAIFIQNKDAANGFTFNPSIVFNESNKTSAFTSTFRTVNQTPSKLVIKLFENSALNAGGSMQDATTAAFRDDFKNAISDEDVTKFTNSDENIAIQRGSSVMGVEGRPTVNSADTIPIRMWNLFANNNYTLKIEGADFDAGVQAMLRDKYLGKLTALDMNGSISYPFAFNTDSASFYNRFEVVLNTQKILPVTITSIKAYSKGAGIQVDWSTATESSIDHYEVERSADGRTFSKAGSVAATANNNGSASYTWFDGQAINGDNYYRIKAVGKAGDVTYTSIVKVTIGRNELVQVFPNPVKGRQFLVKISSIQKGDYTISLYSKLGQLLFSKKYSSVNGAFSETIQLKQTVPAGTYNLVIRKQGEVIHQQNVVFAN